MCKKSYYFQIASFAIWLALQGITNISNKYIHRLIVFLSGLISVLILPLGKCGHQNEGFWLSGFTHVVLFTLALLYPKINSARALKRMSRVLKTLCQVRDAHETCFRLSIGIKYIVPKIIEQSFQVPKIKLIVCTLTLGTQIWALKSAPQSIGLLYKM